MQKITRRPGNKKSKTRQRIRANNRQKRRAAREHQRKLKRKLCHIVEELRDGHYEGVRESPLLRANWGLAMKMLKWG